MDAELLQQHRAGDDRAFADIVRRHTPWIYSLALRGCRDAHLAEDVVQAVFILLHRKGPRFAGDGAMINWLHKVARYAAATAARSERRRRRHQAEAAMLPAPNEPSQWSELAPLLDQLIDRLPQAERQAILLRYFLNMSFAEVGAQFHCTAEAARKRIGRSIEKLRALAEGKGIALSTAGLLSLFAQHARISAPAGLVARAVTLPAPGSALAASCQPIVKGTVTIMNLLKGTSVAMSSLAMAAVIGSGIFLAKAAPPAGPPAAAPVVGNQTAAYPKLSPFEAIRWRPQVQVNGKWYELVAIDQINIDDMVNFVRKNYGAEEVEKRIDEDLVEVMSKMGHAPGKTVSLGLIDISGPREMGMYTQIPMTSKNRQAIWAARNAK